MDSLDEITQLGAEFLDRNTHIKKVIMILIKGPSRGETVRYLRELRNGLHYLKKVMEELYGVGDKKIKEYFDTLRALMSKAKAFGVVDYKKQYNKWLTYEPSFDLTV